MTEPISPAAQAVLDAFWEGIIYHDDITDSNIAAALRAAADQVVPHEEAPFMEGEDHAIRWEQVQHTRRQFLAIAAELEGIE